MGRSSGRLLAVALTLSSCAAIVPGSRAADCSNGAEVAADLFPEADREAARRQCRDLTVRVPAAAVAVVNPVAGANMAVGGEIVDALPGPDSGGFLKPIGKVAGALQAGGETVEAGVRKAIYAGCILYKEFTGFAGELVQYWNQLAANQWATLGPRQLEYDTVQTGTVVNPTKRTFVSAVPLESDSFNITVTKKGGGSSTHVVVCSHGSDGSSRLERDTIIAGDRPDGFAWSTGPIEGALDRIVSVQLEPQGMARRLGYTLKAEKGPLAEPAPQEAAPPATPPEPAPSAQAAPLPGGGVAPVPPSVGAGALPGTTAPVGRTHLPAEAGVTSPTTPMAAATPDAAAPEHLPGPPTPLGTPATGSLPAPSVTPAPLPADASATTGQCMVSSTSGFPEIRLRCGLSPRDERTRVAEDFMADCPLVAGDTVNVRIVEGQRQMQIVGRASGGDWCSQAYRPGYYTGPCLSEKDGDRKITERTLFYQGRRIVDSVTPGGCTPARLAPGIYRVISEHRVSGGGQPSDFTLQEGGLRLEGQELIGDVRGLLSGPIEQR